MSKVISSPIEGAEAAGEQECVSREPDHEHADNTASSSGVSPDSQAICDPDLEATELEERLRGRLHPEVEGEEPSPLRRLPTAEHQRTGRAPVLRRFWRNHVSVNVPHDLCRDHLALERTFLGYSRTALALSIIGVTVAQLYPLQSEGDKVTHRTLTFQRLALPLSVVFIASSMVVTLLGTVRFWRQQNAMVRGKIHTASWETIGTGALVALLCLALFILNLAAQPERPDDKSEL